MNVSAAAQVTVQAPVQRPQAAPRDADGDHDGTTAAAARNARPPAVVSNGQVDGYV
jgi:hypothetical protein